jgi:DNA polymerase-3 subunit epsilon
MDLSKLKLKKPLVIFDLETTGTDLSKDRIVEIAMIKVHPDGTVEKKPEARGEAHRLLINPGMPIPLETSLIHGVYDSDVEDRPTFKQFAKSMSEFLEGCDLGGYNSNRFDVPFLAEEFLRSGIDFDLEGRNLIDVQNIFHLMEQRTLRAAYRFYCGKELEGAHEALPDTEATLEVLLAQLAKYPETTVKVADDESIGPVPTNMDELHVFCQRQRFADLAGRFVYDDTNQVLFNFGQHKGKKVSDILSSNPGYFGWMMKADFPEYTKKVLRRIHEEMNG